MAKVTTRIVQRTGRYAAILISSPVIAFVVFIVGEAAGVNLHALAE
jgi:hypothetical protein